MKQRVSAEITAIMRTDLRAAGFDPDKYAPIELSVINRKNRRCPKCRSTFIDRDPYQRRWRCLIKKCGWIEENESSPEDATHYYKYITGNWYWKDAEYREGQRGRMVKAGVCKTLICGFDSHRCL